MTTAVGDGRVRRQLGGGKRSIGVGTKFDLGDVTTCPENITKNVLTPRAFNMLMYISYRHASVITSHANYMQSFVMAKSGKLKTFSRGPKNVQHIARIFTEKCLVGRAAAPLPSSYAYEEKASVFSGTVFTGVSSFSH